LFISRSAGCDTRPVGCQDVALRRDQFGKLRRKSVVHRTCRLGIATKAVRENEDPQVRQLRDKHESVVCHVMVSFILMTRPRDGQVEHRVKEREATAGGGKRRSRFFDGALLQGDGKKLEGPHSP
ncbi:MAG: hypothetical protein AB7U38_12375, partial [Hyphomicrobiales bacterium]